MGQLLIDINESRRDFRAGIVFYGGMVAAKRYSNTIQLYSYMYRYLLVGSYKHMYLLLLAAATAAEFQSSVDSESILSVLRMRLRTVH